MCSLRSKIPAEVQEFDLILLKELNKKKLHSTKKSGSGCGAEGGSQRSLGWVLCVAAAGGSEVDLWAGVRFQERELQGRKAR